MTTQVNHGSEAIPRRWGGLFAFAVLSLYGCGTSSGGYDATLRYPLRSDVVVIRPPYAEPTELHPPGRRDESTKSYGKEPGGKVVDPSLVDPVFLAALTTTLDEAFGTPAMPKLPGADLAREEELAKGSRLYRSQCAHCHGLTGDGRGPTGQFLEPPPRDFRTGGFKSSHGAARPSEAALRRVLKTGVPGTQMQAYDLLSDAEIDAILAYVVHLSVRGECEAKVLLAYDSDEPPTNEEVPALVEQSASSSIERRRSSWKEPLPVVELPKDADAIRRGHALTSMVGCTTCHGGNLEGGSLRYDVWGNVLRVPGLTKAEWKWGREPGDLHTRVRHGIAPSNMPANPALNERQVNDLAAFLSVIGRPDLLPDDVRKDVYKP